MKRIPLHLIMSNKIIRLLNQGSNRTSTQELIENNQLVQKKTDTKGFQLNGDIFICSRDLYEGLTPTAVRLVMQIQRELEMNNPLWEYSDKESSHNRKALALLKKKDIISAIPGTDLFIINPAKIRRGRPLTIYAALYKLADKAFAKDKNWMPSSKDIRGLSTPDNIELQLAAARLTNSDERT